MVKVKAWWLACFGIVLGLFLGVCIFQTTNAAPVGNVFNNNLKVIAELDSQYEENFAQNDISFYDPDENASGCYSGVSISGDTIMAKVISYLKGNNPTGFVLSDNGIAGVLANFQAESAFNPFRFQNDSLSGPGYGIAQFTPKSKITNILSSDPRTASYFNEYYVLEYTKTDGSTGLPFQSVPMDVVDAWLSVQLDFFFGASSEFENTKVGSYRNLGGTMGLNYIDSSMTVHEALDAAQSPEDATRIFVWIMERPGDKAGAASGRSQNAQKWFEVASSVSASGGGGDSTDDTSASNSTDGSNVTIIGDSITVGSEAEILELLPEADINAQVSKQFYKGTSDNPGGITILQELVDEGSLRDVLVYALGTNSSGITESQVQEVLDLAGSSRQVVFVTNYTTSSDYVGNNNIFIKAKNDNSNVFVADWKSAIESDPSKYLSSDGIHPNADGRALFASIINSTINGSNNTLSSCGSSGGGAVEGGLTAEQINILAGLYDGPVMAANCPEIVKWFMANFTDLGHPGTTGNGRSVAHNMSDRYGLEHGTEPRPFAIFSSMHYASKVCKDGHKCGHTGLVLAVDGDKLLTLETIKTAGLHERSAAHMNYNPLDPDYVYAYLDGHVDMEKLSQALGGL